MTRSIKSVWIPALALLLMLATLEMAGAASPTATVLGALTEGLRSPGKVAVDPAGKLYVADARKGGIVSFDGNGRLVGVIRIPGVVRSVTASPDGSLLVSHDAKVGIYGSDGVLLRELTGFTFLHPNGIALDGAGNIYVADSKANRIAVFTADGTFRNAFGSAGSQPGELSFPTALAFEKAGNLLAVADTMNNRIQFFTPEGGFKKYVGGSTYLSGPLSFTYPSGIAFDYASGVRMYVSDGFQSSVQAIDLGERPRFVGYLGGYGQGEGEFRLLTDVFFDQQSRTLITADATGAVTFFDLGGAGAAAGGQSAAAGGVAGSGATGATAPAYPRWGFPAAGRVASGTDTPGSTKGGSGPWNYPAGTDCSHGRVGSVICR